jgi:hypothetical protein
MAAINGAPWRRWHVVEPDPSEDVPPSAPAEADRTSAPAEADPVPPAVVAAAHRSASHFTDAELARLIRDRTLPRAGTSGAAARLIAFETADVTVVLEVLPAAAGRRVLGRLLPTAAVSVELCQVPGTSRALADEAGCFTAEVAPGPLSVACDFGLMDRRPLVTSWVSI